MEQMSLFDDNRVMYDPLASRLRPSGLEEFVGQKNLVGEGKVLRRLIDQGVPLKEVNVGNMHFTNGKRALTKKVYVDDKDMDDLKYIASKGVRVYCQDVPGESIEIIQ